VTLGTGTVVAGYRVEAVLGQGSMGTVYSALDQALDRRVALKVLTPELARDERFRERFLRESKLAASLEHPHIVPIHAAGEIDGVLYIAMRYVDGRDLGALLESLGRLDVERTLLIAGQVAGALDAAHERGLVHRDVKPANILLAKGDYAYLCDFGLAKHASTVSSLTGSRAILGTVDYLAPEQIEAKPVDGRVDVYALGCVVYECLTGEPPHRRGNELAALLAHVNDAPPQPSERRAELPAALDDVIATALAKDREARFATCSELVTAVRVAMRGEVPELPATPVAAAPAVRTFLFADVRGYTAYTREHGDEAGAALARQFASIVESLGPEHAGTLQELRGDEALVVFDSARQALRFAVALQAKLLEDELPRPVGIGLDTGEAVPVEDGYRGGALNRAARLCSLARPGEILATDAVRELAGATESVAYGFRRVERLKGFDKPVGVVEIHSAEAAPRRELGRAVRARALGTRPRRRLAVGVAVLAGAAVAAIALARVLGGPGGPAPAKSVAVLNAASGTTRRHFDADGEFQFILPGDGVLYGVDLDGGLIARIDPVTASVTDRYALPDVPYEYIAPDPARGSWWVADGSGPRILRMNPDQPGSPIRIPLPDTHDREASGVAVTSSGIWASFDRPTRIARIDPATNRVVADRELEGSDLFDGVLLASDGDVLWAVQRNGRKLWRLDPRSGAVLATGSLEDDFVEDAAVANGYLWIAQQTAGGVWKVDGRGSTLGKIDTGARPWVVVRSDDALWVPNANSGTVTRIDPETDATETFEVGHRPIGLAVANDRVFVSLGISAADALARIDGDRILTSAVVGNPISTTDPGTGFPNEDIWLVQHATGARLMQYKVKADGSGEIVPELAVGPPTVSADGLTYTYRVRKGFGFSPPLDDEVTAATVRSSIERAREQSGYCDDAVFGVIRSMRSRGDRITFVLHEATGDLSARLATGCASTVPAGAPHRRDGVYQPLPSAGPYYVDTHIDGQQVVLLRNPNYGGRRPQHLDAIVFRLGYSSDAAARAVDAGEADWVAGEENTTGVLGPEGELARTFGPGAGKRQRWFSAPRAATQFLVPNWARGPLRDARVRQAVSLSLDRRALARVWNGAPQATIIPPGVPGYTRADPDAMRPTVDRARRLLGGRRVALDLVVNDSPEYQRVADLVRADLARIGIGLRVRTASASDNIVIANDPKEGIDLLSLGWYMDWADPGNAFSAGLVAFPGEDRLFPSHPPGARAPSWERLATRARRIAEPSRTDVLSRLDRRLARVEVPVIVYAAIGGRPVFFAERVGCETFLPMFGGLPDPTTLCIEN
jgi:ABC-type transport system substrate-binding protein/class 3 adenylate cyclase/tRNA A-37 threonylcarbamoyl transferase component Bud32